MHNDDKEKRRRRSLRWLNLYSAVVSTLEMLDRE